MCQKAVQGEGYGQGSRARPLGFKSQLYPYQSCELGHNLNSPLAIQLIPSRCSLSICGTPGTVQALSQPQLLYLSHGNKDPHGGFGRLNVILLVKPESSTWTGNAWFAAPGAEASQHAAGQQEGRKRRLSQHCFPDGASAPLLVWIVKPLARADQALLFLSLHPSPVGRRLTGSHRAC